MPLDDPKELFIVVDKDDNVLGYRSRYDCHHDKSLIHRAAMILIYNNDGKLLMQKRTITKDLFPGMWGLSASGHVSKDESYEDAAKRELFEELGIQTELEYIGKVFVESSDETEIEGIFKGIHDGPYAIDSDEIDNVKLFDVSKLESISSYITPGSKAVLKYLKLLS